MHGIKQSLTLFTVSPFCSFLGVLQRKLCQLMCAFLLCLTCKFDVLIEGLLVIWQWQLFFPESVVTGFLMPR